MDAAKAAINKFTSNRGHHTTVEETVQPAVTTEVIKPHRHEEVTQAIDREVHQHHHHTTVQPLTAQEVLPEKHVHQAVAVENREFRHDNEQETKQRLAADLSHFKDTRRVEQTRVTQAQAGTVTGEHVHHHVHETVIPVVHKETIQPEVVHTTIPIHETHIAATQHHGLSALPMKTLDEFTRAGGKLTGGAHGSHEEYDGQPRQYNEKLTTTFDKLGLGSSSHQHQTGSGMGAGAAGAGVAAAGAGAAAHHHRRRGSRSSSSSSSSSDESVGGTRRKKDRLSRKAVGGAGVGAGAGGLTGSGPRGTDVGAGAGGLTGSGHRGAGGLTGNESRGTGAGIGSGGLTGNGSRTSGSNIGSHSTGHNTGSSNTGAKPSLLDRLNPLKDADGDGKAGLGK